MFGTFRPCAEREGWRTKAANCGECGKAIWNDITDILTIIDLNKSMGDLLLQKHVVKPALFSNVPISEEKSIDVVCRRRWWFLHVSAYTCTVEGRKSTKLWYDSHPNKQATVACDVLKLVQSWSSSCLKKTHFFSPGTRQPVRASGESWVPGHVRRFFFPWHCPGGCVFFFGWCRYRYEDGW